jgi:hypothetical protein
VIARCERRIGQELRVVPLHKGGRPSKTGPAEGPVSRPTLEELNLTKNESAAYQELASVEEQVILDAIAVAGAEGREVTKKDIRQAVREALGKAHLPEAKPVDPDLRADLEAASEARPRRRCGTAGACGSGKLSIYRRTAAEANKRIGNQAAFPEPPSCPNLLPPNSSPS